MKRKVFIFGIAVIVLLGTLLYGANIGPVYKGLRKEIFPVLKTTPSVRSAQLGAEDWPYLFLSSRYHPPKNSMYVPLPRVSKTKRIPKGESYDGSGSQCDKLRMCYRVGDDIVTITQMRSFFSIQVDMTPDKENPEVTLEQVQEIARGLFIGGQDLELVPEDKAKDDFIEGTIKRSNPETSPWLGHMLWWKESTSFGFYFLKHRFDDTPSKVSLGISVGMNGYWFSKSDSRVIIKDKSKK